MKMLGCTILAILFGLTGIVVLIGALNYQSDIPVAKLEPKYMSANSRYVTMDDGLKVHVRDEGNLAGDVLVLVHGLSASLHTWEMWVERLKDSYRIISLDLAGHGLTGPDPIHDYTMSGQSALVNELLQKLGVDKYSIVGSSMGGHVAWRHALDFSENVEKVVLVGASGYPRPEADPGLLWKLLQSERAGKFLMKVTPRFVVSSMVRATYGNSDVANDEVIDRYWHLALREGNRQAAMILLNTGGVVDEHLQLKALQKPVLVMWGANDPLVPVGDAYKFHEDLPISNLVIYEDLAHIPFEEDADRTVADLKAFLEG